MKIPIIKSIISGLVFAILTQICSADPLEKGFERLKVYDYFQAKVFFEKALKNRTAGAAFGLSLIFSTENNPFYNLDSARVYILLADSTFKISTKKLLSVYSETGVSSERISIQTDTICARAFSKIEKSESADQINRYILQFPFCIQQAEALRLKNAAAFKDSRKKGTSIAYKKFMDEYPDAIEWKEAKALYEERLFEEITGDKSYGSYKRYLMQYPDGPYKFQAEKMIYKLSIHHHNIEEYDDFILKNPSSSFVDEAWREVYRIFMKDFNEQTYTAFKLKYPHYPFKDEMEQDYRFMNSLLLPFRRNENWGYLNEEGKEIIKPQYEECELFHEGFAVVKNKGKYGFINKTGKTVIPYVFDEAESFKNKAAVVAVNEKYGLISQSGDTLIGFLYDDLSDPVEDICIALKDERSGYISRSGKKITDFTYDFAGEFSDGFAVVGKEEKYGIIRKTGLISVNLDYDQLLSVSNGLYRAKLENKWGIISSTGEVIVPFIYNRIADFSEGKALVVKNGKCGFINESGKVIIPVGFIYTENLLNTALFKGNYVLLKQKSKSLLLDTIGNKLLNAGFEDLGLLKEGLIPVKKNKKWGYASITGKLKIPFKFQEAYPFESGLAKIVIKNQSGIIDSIGRTIIPPMFEDIQIKPNCFITKENGLFGLQSYSGIMLLARKYDKINILSAKTVEAIKGEKKTYINYISGKVIYEED